MQLPLQVHESHPWRVHEVAHDFRLLDVWRFPLTLDADVSFERFTEFLTATQRELGEGHGPAAQLMRLRAKLGEWFGWDAETAPRPIPGSRDVSVRQRLEESDAELGLEELADELGAAEFSPVYRLEDEALLEISNGTVHALMHLGRFPLDEVGRWAPQMAIYVKERGALGRAYMALISPFRHWIVYPAMMRAVERSWSGFAAREGLA
ncbi:MAG: DUF2867 domain-containing protein [Myxococcota bacterium]|nr:DUF2867 domain-containing protein [Myxococcota bacterium]